jgi:hypothetical protein
VTKGVYEIWLGSAVYMEAFISPHVRGVLGNRLLVVATNVTVRNPDAYARAGLTSERFGKHSSLFFPFLLIESIKTPPTLSFISPPSMVP